MGHAGNAAAFQIFLFTGQPFVLGVPSGHNGSSTGLCADNIVAANRRDRNRIFLMVNIVLYYLNLFQCPRSLFRFHRSLDEIEYQDDISASASTSDHVLLSHASFTILTPPKRIAALTTPISAPPAMKPDASSVPFSPRSALRAASLLRLVTYQLRHRPLPAERSAPTG